MFKRWTFFRVTFALWTVVGMALVGQSKAIAGGPFSISFFGGHHWFTHSSYVDASLASGLETDDNGSLMEFFTVEYRVNPHWSVALTPLSPFYGWDTTPPPGLDRSMDVFGLLVVTPRYYLVSSKNLMMKSHEIYVGAGPGWYEISEGRPKNGLISGAETQKKVLGGMTLVGIELRFGPVLGIPIEARYTWVPPMDTSLGRLNGSGFSWAGGFRFHFGAS